MNNLSKLVKGELIRLTKYKILLTGIVVSLIWVIVIGLSEKSEVEELMPLLMSMDAALMSIILLAASFYLEKQEGTIKSLLVTPIKVLDVLISKIIAAVIGSLISAVMVVLVSVIVHKVEISFLLLLVYILIIVVSHVAIGLVITLNSKDFGSMIGLYAAFTMVTLIPSILYMIEVIPEKFNKLLLLSPFHGAQMLLSSLFKDIDLTSIILTLVYLTLISVGLYVGVIYKKFKKYAIEG